MRCPHRKRLRLDWARILAPRRITELIHGLLYGRLPVAKFALRCWISGCGSISGLLAQVLCLRALMDSADPRLIPSVGLMPRKPFRFRGSRSYLFAITSCRTWRNLFGVSSLADAVDAQPTRLRQAGIHNCVHSADHEPAWPTSCARSCWLAPRWPRSWAGAPAAATATARAAWSDGSPRAHRE